MGAEKGTISCKELRESLSAYLDDRMAPYERERVESHLSSCRQCSKEMAAVVGVREHVMKASGTLSDRITPSSDIWLGIKRQLAVEERKSDSAWELAKSKLERKKEIAMKALFSKRPVWKVAVISGVVVIALIVGLILGIPSGESAYAQAERIASESREVQAALGGEVSYANTISLQDNIGTLVCSGEAGGMAAVTVDIGNKSVTDVLPIELTKDEEQRAVDIAMADSRIRDLVAQGAVLGNVSPDYILGNSVNAGTRYVLPNLMIAARMSLELDYHLWYITIDLDAKKVHYFVEVSKQLISMGVISPEQVRQAIAITEADSRVKELLDQGAVIVSAGSGVATNDEGIPEYTSAVLTLGDKRWQVAINLIRGQVTAVSEDPFGNISSEELESFFSIRYALSPLEVRTILGIVESDEAVKAIMATGAEILTIRPVVEWACDTVGNESGVLRQVCHKKDGEVKRVDVMLGMGQRWWDVIVDVDSQKVVEIGEYSYDSGQGVQSGNVSTGTSVEELDELSASGYALAPLEVREILGIVESDEAVKAIMGTGAEIFTIRPVAEWACDTVGNESGVLRQVCHKKDGEVKRVDVMFGMGQRWWDVIVDVDSRKVVEIRAYTYDGSVFSEECHGGNGSITITDAGQPVAWETDLVSLAAGEFYIVADGVQYIADVQSVDVDSDPGDSEFCTLELTWNEHGNEMRLFMYFVSDGTYWWANEIRTYNGQSNDSDCLDWIYYTGQFFKTKLGTPFAGDVDLTCDTNNSFQGKIHFKGLELQAFLNAK